MRILFYSDLHLEMRTQETRVPWTDFYPLDLGPRLTPFVGEVDLLVLAGDIATARPRAGFDVLDYAVQAGAYLYCPVALVPGNHEYYGGDFLTDRAALLAARVPRVTVLDRGEAMFTIGRRRLRVLGATLWTDYRLLGDQATAMRAARATMNDHRMIAMGGGANFQPEDALREHELSRRWLIERLAEPHDGPTLIVTHHVPHSMARNPNYPLDQVAPAFYSDCDDLIAAAEHAGVAAMICGHHHWSMRITVGNVPILSAQPGYPRERNTGWAGPGLLEIPAA